MKYSKHFNLWLPEDTDPVKISDLSENFAALDELFGDNNAKIAVGSYEGNGKYGSGNPTKLVFPFTPKLLLVNYSYTMSMYAYSISNRGWVAGPEAISSGPIQITFGNTVSWYSSDSALKQMNTSSFTYFYVAIG